MIDSTLAHQKYVRRTLIFMGCYVGLNVAAMCGLVDVLGPSASWLFGLAVAVPIAAHIWAVLSLMRESDEFLRSLLARRFIVASGTAMALFCGWGFLESYARAPHAPGWLIMPVFWAVFGAVSPFIQTTR